ncbi:class I SAM-dependent methyltransferase [Metallibacterium sp.]|uniref:class I SAM-dependent DNA methyltransferase n=1 Tax=Metallibacterium sp. TaxID=2940281 RepID=UPI002610AF9A|nr:class I SAM-dependent methyltransferase [Metallibacterium sp.]
MSSLLQETNRQRFDSIAADWDDSPMRRAMAGGVAAAIAAAVPLQAQWQALEYGCGTGLVGAQLAPRLRHLLACDLSPGMLAVLDEKARAAGLDNLRTRVLDLTREAPPAQRFDLIFSSMTLHHIPDVPALLRILHGMLAEGGWVALADLDAEDGGFHNPDVPGVAHHGFERAELTCWLQAAGFRDISARTAHTAEKTRAGKTALYPIFLITARR